MHPFLAEALRNYFDQNKHTISVTDVLAGWLQVPEREHEHWVVLAIDR